MSEAPNSFAQWLHVTMQHHGLSQAALARTVGVADAQVSRWRRGQVVPSVRYLQQIADTFGVPRTTLDRLAGYPVDATASLPGQPDPARQAEQQALEARYREILADRVPLALWPAYIESCAALADAMSAALAAAEEAAGRSGPRRDMGFRRK
ncbi:MAG TPA: helix-turn-helix domain-containing protein [Chloroflexia bacterium]|nr:helix-turn-helix domain-containing protein [Chloroflexia bacterium]